MKIPGVLLVFTTPFIPKRSYKEISVSKNKWLFSILSIVITLSIIAVLFNAYNAKRSHIEFQNMELAAFVFGMAVKIILIGVITSIFASRLYKERIRMINGMSIVSLATLPLVLESLFCLISDQHKAFFEWPGMICFGVLMGFGIAEFYERKLKSALIMSFGTLLTIELFETLMFGIQL